MGVGSGPPRVSVIVPFYNAERFIGEAIESVLAQTYRAWELLLIDDGSTDASTDIARRYASAEEGRIVYLGNRGPGNRGVAATRNLGVRFARGQFLAMLDADDVWLPDKLTEQVALLDAHPDVAMLYGNTLYWHSWTGDPSDTARDHCPGGMPLRSSTDSLDILAGYLKGNVSVPCPCSVIARRAIVEQVGGFEESIGTILEDQAFFAKMLIAGPVHIATQTWDRYRIHPDSACAVAERRGEVLAARLAFLGWLEGYLKQQGVEHRRVWSALRADRWRCRYPGIGRRVGGMDRRLRRLAATVPEPVRKGVRGVLARLSRAAPLN
jgi:glycosyltransferase involved in cell wall biosynthesis